MPHYCTIDGSTRVDQISFIIHYYDCAVRSLEFINLELSFTTILQVTPDIYVNATVYAASFLLKLIKPKFHYLVSEELVLGLTPPLPSSRTHPKINSISTISTRSFSASISPPISHKLPLHLRE